MVILTNLVTSGISALIDLVSKATTYSIEYYYKSEIEKQKLEADLVREDKKFENAFILNREISDRKREIALLIEKKKFENTRILNNEIIDRIKEMYLSIEDKKFENALTINNEIIDKTHILRLQEQRDYFLYIKGQMDYKFFLEHSWPLISPPDMLPYFTNHTTSIPCYIPLLIICTGYSQKIAPIIGDAINKLDQFLNATNEDIINQERRTILYTGGWRTDENFGQLQGNAILEILYKYLRGYPTLVLQPIYYESDNKISFNASFWGLGPNSPMVTKEIFNISYSGDSFPEEKLILMKRITSGLAIASISISDTYHFLEYNSMPQFKLLLKNKDIFDDTLIPIKEWILMAKTCFSTWCRLNDGNNLLLMPEVGALFLDEYTNFSNSESQLWIIEESNNLFKENIHFRFLYENASNHNILFKELTKNYKLLSALYKLARKCMINQNSDIIQAWNFYIEKYEFIQ